MTSRLLLADAAAPLDVPAWSAAPFAVLLLLIAILPLVAGHYWHSNLRKALIVALISLPVVGYLVYRNADSNGAALLALEHALLEYVSFIVLLGALYTVSGGILLSGDIEAKPINNTLFLAFGAVIANIIGTTGASMVLIRPVLQTNRQRKNVAHIPVFFIFTVSNVGGLLTPLGDPPLFLGFLNGVAFTWTLTLWPQWLLVNGILLAVFYVWDSFAYASEPEDLRRVDAAAVQPLRLRGLVNLLFLAGILAAVLLQSEQLADAIHPQLHLSALQGAGVMAGFAALSLLCTPRGLRAENRFTWYAIVEVAVLFAGIFVTMVPALALLKLHGPEFGIEQPWEFFWLTGGLSSFLDNAPTYLTFATLAASPHDFRWLMVNRPDLLAAISCGAVFMGANTYIGNGPNFMVKAIADEAGYKTPSFFGYMLYSGGILLPVFVLVTYLFF